MKPEQTAWMDIALGTAAVAAVGMGAAWMMTGGGEKRKMRRTARQVAHGAEKAVMEMENTLHQWLH